MTLAVGLDDLRVVKQLGCLVKLLSQGRGWASFRGLRTFVDGRFSGSSQS
jgi:hypothetical protein